MAFVLIGALIAIFTALSVACAIASSKLIAAIQQSTVGQEIREQAEAEQREPRNIWQVRRSEIFGFHPFNENVWAEILRREVDLPADVRPDVRSLRTLTRLRIAAFVIGVILVIAVQFHWM